MTEMGKPINLLIFEKSMNTNFEQAWGGTFTRKAQQELPGVPSTAQEREAAFTALLQSGSGLKRVAFAMQAPLKNRLDYVAVGRKLFLVDELPLSQTAYTGDGI